MQRAMVSATGTRVSSIQEATSVAVDGPQDGKGKLAMRWKAFAVDRRAWLVAFVLALSVGFYAAGFLHLLADFPNGPMGNDFSKVSDEGWWAQPAVQKFTMGTWYTPGGYQPEFVMPVWPVMLAGWFAVTGPSMTAMRALTMVFYGGSLMLLYGLLRRVAGATPLLAAAGVLVTVVNPYSYAYHRLSLLEPVLEFWLMLALWMASSPKIRQRPFQFLLGLVLCLAVLTKTNAVMAMPAVLYLMWATQASFAQVPARTVRMGRAGSYLLSGLVVCGTMAVVLVAWFELVVRPHHLAEAVQVFTLNNFHGAGWQLMRAGWRTVKTAALLLQPVECPAAILFVLLAAVGFRQLWRVPVLTAFVILAAGELAFIAYHTPWVPRYYQVLVMPMAVIACIGTSVVWQHCGRLPRLLLAAGWCFAGAMMVRQTLECILHPRYTYLHVAQNIAAIVRQDHEVPPRTLGASCGAITLMGGVSSICDFGLMVSEAEMADRYHVGWFVVVVHGELPPPDLETLEPRYRAERRAEYHVFDLDPTTLWLMRVTPR